VTHVIAALMHRTAKYVITFAPKCVALAVAAVNAACQLSAVVPFRLLVLRSGTAYQTMSLPFRPCQPSGAI